MKNYLSLFLIFSLMAACTGATNETTETSDKDPSTNMTTPDEVISEDLPLGFRSVIAVYKSCAVYTGATDYFFIKEDGQGVNFRIANTEGLSEEEINNLKSKDSLEGINIHLEHQMIDKNNKLEGPPGANPKFIDKKFYLIYNESGKLVEVKLLK
ncbi:hypothetical protein OAK19_02135 [Aureispira]|nr:hypothetical protein [Aureispira sp.]